MNTTGLRLIFLIALAGFISCHSEKAVAPPPPEIPPEAFVVPPSPAPEIPPEAPVVPPSPARPPAQPTLEDYLAEIAALLDKGDYEGALAEFSKIPSPEAESAGIRLLRVSVLSSAGKLAEARQAVEAVIKDHPQNMDALFVLSTIEGASGKDREQRALLDRILKAQPGHVDSLISLGDLNLQRRSWKAAADYFDQALKAEPQNHDALLGRAGVYRYQRDRKNAEALLNKVISLYPGSFRGWSERARLYREADYPSLAMADIDRAKKLAPNNYWVAVDRGSILLDLNKRSEALEEFRQAIAMDPNNFLAYIYSAGIKDDTDDYEGAEHDYGILTKLNPDYYFAFEGLGMYKMKKGLWAEARNAFQEAYKRAPTETSYALLAAINWMRATGRPGDAKNFLAQALRTIPRETPEWYLFRLFHDMAGDNDVAMRADREKIPEKKARLLFYLANYYDIRGNKALAEKYYVQSGELGRQGIPEWKLNQWTLESRNLVSF
ncbi:hypothetical protein AGMMS49928_20270 [Spirochaetia bacterium]|nr:hypothetical protein AGMMS49928_20270 [Spirochaetia bacterium]